MVCPLLARSTVRTVDCLRIDAIELAHAQRKIAFNGFHDQVVVVGHLAPSVHSPIAALAPEL